MPIIEEAEIYEAVYRRNARRAKRARISYRNLGCMIIGVTAAGVYAFLLVMELTGWRP